MSGVLISGAITPLGVRFAERLIAEGRGPVLGVGIEPIEVAERWLPPEVRYHRVDLTRARQVRRLLYGVVRAERVEAVVHLAFHRRAAERSPRAHKLHVEATDLMLRLAENHPTISRFVYRSDGSVYRRRADSPDVLREDHPLELSGSAPWWVRDRVEADVTVCTRMGLSRTHIAVLRMSEVVAPRMGSQLLDYLSSRVCLRALGFDPMLNLLSLDDAARALALALDTDAQGVFNVPGADTLPLSRVIQRWGRRDVGIPGPLLGPLYRLRSAVRGTDFRYDLNRWRFHVNGVLDGARAATELGYRPAVSIPWPVGTPREGMGEGGPPWNATSRSPSSESS